jgi:hypothetical protein
MPKRAPVCIEVFLFRPPELKENASTNDARRAPRRDMMREGLASSTVMRHGAALKSQGQVRADEDRYPEGTPAQ